MLVLPQSRQGANGVALRFLTEKLDGLLQAQPRRRRNGDREPQVEIVVSLVVRRHAGMGVDDRSRVVDPIGRYARRHEAGTVAERARVEVSAETANDAVALEPLGTFDDFLLRHV